jgi:translation initiation factor 1 (eIF-1/SUI1)
MTTVSGLPTDLDLEKSFHTNGTIIEDPDEGTVIKVAGDKRAEIKDFLIKTSIYEKGKDELQYFHEIKNFLFKNYLKLHI